MKKSAGNPAPDRQTNYQAAFGNEEFQNRRQSIAQELKENNRIVPEEKTELDKLRKDINICLSIQK